MKKALICIFVISIFWSSVLCGQVVPFSVNDTLPKQNDSLPSLSDPRFPVNNPVSDSTSDKNYSISENAPQDPIEFGAKDSMKFNNVQNKMYLYGDAFVKFQRMELKAGHIVLDLDSNEAVAQTFVDSIGKTNGRPQFSDGQQNFSAERLRYNFNSQKGLVYGVSTTQSNLFLTGTKTKIVSQDVIKDDTSFTDNILYNKRAIFSTCDLPHPHYGIRSSRQKVVADKVVVAGPSNLEIKGVPLPIVLPFAVFPLKKISTTGLIFPQSYEYSPQLGFGLNGVGWYFPFSDYMDMRLTGQIYFHGTWGLSTNVQYRRRYKYRGNLQLSYTSRKEIDNPFRTNAYSIVWSHNQDSKAHPARSLQGRVNIQGNGFQSLVNNDAQSVLQNTLSSNVNYTQSFPDRPYRLSLEMRHSQNTRSRKVDISLPIFNFQLNRIYPFKNKGSSKSSKEKWYEKISLTYNANLQNKFTATDTTLFTQQTLNDARAAFEHDINTDLNFNLFKHINVSPNVSFSEAWNFHTTRKYLNRDSFLIEIDTTESIPDTIEYGTVISERNFGLEPFREMRTGVSFNTILYGTLPFKKGRLRGIRHTAKPSLSFNYVPATNSNTGFFRRVIDSVDTDIRPEFNTKEGYSIFEGGVHQPSRRSKMQMLMSYSINNIFEAKYFSRKDSTEKKIKLFDNIRVSGNYNFAADSLKFSPVSLRGTTRLLKGMTTIGITASWDPYALNIKNRRIDRFYWKEEGKLLRFVSANFQVNSRLSVATLKKIFKKEKTATSAQKSTSNNQNTPPGNNQESARDDSFLKFLEGFSLNHSFLFNADGNGNAPANWNIRTNSLSLRVTGIELSPKWSVGIGNIGYDFKNRRTTYPDLNVTRDLHCWRAFFSWQPQRGTFFLTIQVKNAPMDMLKIPYSKNNVDAFGGF